jgi:hypothetical protein
VAFLSLQQVKAFLLLLVPYEQQGIPLPSLAWLQAGA